MNNTREYIQKAFDGEISEKELHEKLDKRTEREIIDDLKLLEFEGLINTEECLNDYLDTMSELDENSRAEQKSTIESAEKALGYLHIAIKERCNELIDCEKKVKELIFNS